MYHNYFFLIKLIIYNYASFNNSFFLSDYWLEWLVMYRPSLWRRLEKWLLWLFYQGAIVDIGTFSEKYLKIGTFTLVCKIGTFILCELSVLSFCLTSFPCFFFFIVLLLFFIFCRNLKSILIMLMIPIQQALTEKNYTLRR